MSVKLICMLALCMAQAQAQAQAQAHAERDTLVSTQKVIVNGSQSEMDANQDTIAGKTVIGKQRISDSGLQNVGELLRREPAISIAKDGRLGLLGMPGYTQVLVDGLPPQGDAFSLDLVQIERIEIMKSTTASTGPIGIAGTINIIRRKAERKAFTQGSVGASDGGHGLGSSASWVNNQIVADNPLVYNLTLSASRKKMPTRSDYIETVANLAAASAPTPEFEGRRSSVNVFDIISASSELAWRLDASNKVSMRPDLTSIKSADDSAEQRLGYDGVKLSLRQNPSNILEGWSLPLRLERQIDPATGLAIQLNVNHSKMDIAVPLLEEGTDAVFRTRANNQRRLSTNYFLDVDFNTELPGQHALTAGLKLVRNDQHTTYDDTIDNLPDASLTALGRDNMTHMNSGRLFLQDEWRIDRTWAINAGLSVERRVYSFQEGPVHNAADFNMWSPSLHLSKKLGGNRGRQIRFSFARSFAPPHADQMLIHPTINPFAPCPAGRLCGANGIDMADTTGNPYLRPERALGVNLSYTHSIGVASEVLVEGFARDIQQKIGWEYALEDVAWAAAPRYVYRPVNLGQAKVEGINLEGRMAGKDIAKTLAPLELHGSLGFAHSALSDIPGPDNRIADQSPWRVKLGGSYTLQALPLKLGAEASVLPADWVRDNVNERVYTSTKSALGVNAAWKIDTKSKLTLNLDNLLHRTATRIDEYQSGSQLFRLMTNNDDFMRIAVKFDTAL